MEEVFIVHNINYEEFAHGRFDPPTKTYVTLPLQPWYHLSLSVVPGDILDIKISFQRLLAKENSISLQQIVT